MVATSQGLIFRAEALLSLKVVEGFNTRFDLEIFSAVFYVLLRNSDTTKACYP